MRAKGLPVGALRNWYLGIGRHPTTSLATMASAAGARMSMFGSTNSAWWRRTANWCSNSRRAWPSRWTPRCRWSSWSSSTMTNRQGRPSARSRDGGSVGPSRRWNSWITQTPVRTTCSAPSPVRLLIEMTRRELLFPRGPRTPSSGCGHRDDSVRMGRSAEEAQRSPRRSSARLAAAWPLWPWDGVGFLMAGPMNGTTVAARSEIVTIDLASAWHQRTPSASSLRAISTRST